MGFITVEGNKSALCADFVKCRIHSAELDLFQVTRGL